VPFFTSGVASKGGMNENVVIDETARETLPEKQKDGARMISKPESPLDALR
jgi:hypothetical protein